MSESSYFVERMNSSAAPAKSGRAGPSSYQLQHTGRRTKDQKLCSRGANRIHEGDSDSMRLPMAFVPGARSRRAYEFNEFIPLAFAEAAGFGKFRCVNEFSLSTKLLTA